MLSRPGLQGVLSLLRAGDIAGPNRLCSTDRPQVHFLLFLPAGGRGLQLPHCRSLLRSAGALHSGGKSKPHPQRGWDVPRGLGPQYPGPSVLSSHQQPLSRAVASGGSPHIPRTHLSGICSQNPLYGLVLSHPQLVQRTTETSSVSRGKKLDILHQQWLQPLRSCKGSGARSSPHS